MSMEARPYQTAMADLAKRENIIVHQRTGTGKTFTAVLVLDHFLEEKPDKKVMFVVPTRPLVQQQAQYIRQHSRHRQLRVEELSGDATDNWRAAQWQETGPVLVGTAELFRRALQQAFISPAQFSLWVLDECHNAVGNSPFAGIMRCLHAHLPEAEWPRVLGLTASFVNGSLQGIEAKRLKLEQLLQATMHCPDTSAVAQAQQYTTVTFELSSSLKETAWIGDFMEEGFALFPPQYSELLKEKPRLVNAAKVVYENLGLPAFVYFLKHCLIPQLRSYAEKLLDSASGEHAALAEVAQELPGIEEKLRALVESWGMGGPGTETPKYHRLVELLQKLEGAGEEEEGLALGVIFVEQVITSYCLADMLNDSFGRVIAVPVNGPMSAEEQCKNLEAFRKKEVRILVATGALEEGLNVPECSWVIRFDRLFTTKQHIQGSGRARNQLAQIYLFENDAEEEEARRQLLEAVATDHQLAASAAQLLAGREPLNFVAGQHPFVHATGARFDVQTCLPILYEYCQITLRQGLQPDRSLYIYEETIANALPLQVVKKVVAMQYPSPDGVQEVTEEQVRDYWGDTVIEQLFSRETCGKMSGADKQKRWFAFVTVVDLVRRGYLTDENRPSPRALLLTREACPDFA
eukprot:EG_transcript_6477